MPSPTPTTPANETPGYRRGSRFGPLHRRDHVRYGPGIKDTDVKECPTAPVAQLRDHGLDERGKNRGDSRVADQATAQFRDLNGIFPQPPATAGPASP